ncbi:MAG: hypothetical protein HN742_35310 [Lentisphaerae bacterium]|nr:hypothetical protein [Lentisphaerota bacterium]MBT4822544.1 hypothetical protein [Lentisphaerota bacterium]MBT5604687.1 hypothetical protein [Lentisphaerota bacterium]MBT7053813.1 hypothetical protein [Lentisphaerota bacterium]MBT7847192.1 hypothetical protein [Lentisphaerota bacterium]
MSFIGAFTLAGEPLWQYGDKERSVGNTEKAGEMTTTAPMRPGPVAVYDIDQDGTQEVIALTLAADTTATSQWTMADVEMVALDGQTGKVKCRAVLPELQAAGAYVGGHLHVPNYVHHRLLIADLRGQGIARDIVVKLGNEVLALDDQFRLLWHYENRHYIYGHHAAYIPTVGDVDGDGHDEVLGGQFCLDHDGRVLWERDLAEHNDSVIIDTWGGQPCAICSGFGHVLDGEGNVLQCLGRDVVPHGQEIRYGRLLADVPERQLVIRYNGHTPELMVVRTDGTIHAKFSASPSPNNTGMELVHWHGPEAPQLIFTPVELRDATGTLAVAFPDLPPLTPSRLGNQGWYHCIPVDLYGNGYEQLLLYDMYADAVHVYGAPEGIEDKPAYRHTPTQYNVRLMD